MLMLIIINPISPIPLYLELKLKLNGGVKIEGEHNSPREKVVVWRSPR